MLSRAIFATEMVAVVDDDDDDDGDGHNDGDDDHDDDHFNTGLRIAEAATRDSSDAALYPAKLRQLIFQEKSGETFLVAA